MKKEEVHTVGLSDSLPIKKMSFIMLATVLVLTNSHQGNWYKMYCV